LDYCKKERRKETKPWALLPPRTSGKPQFILSILEQVAPISLQYRLVSAHLQLRTGSGRRLSLPWGFNWSCVWSWSARNTESLSYIL